MSGSDLLRCRVVDHERGSRRPQCVLAFARHETRGQGCEVVRQILRQWLVRLSRCLKLAFDQRML